MTGLRARRDTISPSCTPNSTTMSISVRGRLPALAADPAGSGSPYVVTGTDDRAACFSVVELATGELAGEALLWDIDLHNRAAHIGISLLPAFRGRGLGPDAVRVLCRYGFAIRGLHRLQAETLSTNNAMIQAASRAGFTREGTLRRAAWVDGEFADEVILGLLAAEWNAG